MSKPSNRPNSSTPKPSSKPKGKLNNTAKATVKAAATRPIHVFSYVCSSCDRQLFKQPVYTPAEGSKDKKASGLGKWKCSCGNKKAIRRKPQPVTEEKAAA